MKLQKVIVATKDNPDDVEVEINTILSEGYIIINRELVIEDDPTLGLVMTGMVIFEK